MIKLLPLFLLIFSCGIFDEDNSSENDQPITQSDDLSIDLSDSNVVMGFTTQDKILIRYRSGELCTQKDWELEIYHDNRLFSEVIGKEICRRSEAVVFLDIKLKKKDFAGKNTSFKVNVKGKEPLFEFKIFTKKPESIVELNSNQRSIESKFTSVSTEDCRFFTEKHDLFEIKSFEIPDLSRTKLAFYTGSIHRICISENSPLSLEVEEISIIKELLLPIPSSSTLQFIENKVYLNIPLNSNCSNKLILNMKWQKNTKKVPQSKINCLENSKNILVELDKSNFRNLIKDRSIELKLGDGSVSQQVEIIQTNDFTSNRIELDQLRDEFTYTSGTNDLVGKCFIYSERLSSISPLNRSGSFSISEKGLTKYDTDLVPICIEKNSTRFFQGTSIKVVRTGIFKKIEIYSPDTIPWIESTEQIQLPEKLIDTMFSESANNWKPTKNLISYKVQSQLWSDGALKKRYVFVPSNQKIDLDKSFYPDGTLWVKHFFVDNIDGTPIDLETRFTLYKDNKFKFISYSYLDSESQITEGITFPIPENKQKLDSWTIPYRSQCTDCHNNRRVLGFSTAQLNDLDENFPQHKLSQIERLFFSGIAKPFDSIDRKDLIKKHTLVGITTECSTTAVESYLHSNCSHCHNPEGSMKRFNLTIGQTSFENLFEIRLLESPIPDAYFFSSVEGQSGALERLQAGPDRRMPPLAVGKPDLKAIDCIKKKLTEQK